MKIKERGSNKESEILFYSAETLFSRLLDIRREQDFEINEYSQVTLENRNELEKINLYISDKRNAYKISENKLESYFGLYIEFLGEYVPEFFN